MRARHRYRQVGPLKQSRFILHRLHCQTDTACRPGRTAPRPYAMDGRFAVFSVPSGGKIVKMRYGTPLIHKVIADL